MDKEFHIFPNVMSESECNSLIRVRTRKLTMSQYDTVTPTPQDFALKNSIFRKYDIWLSSIYGIITKENMLENIF